MFLTVHWAFTYHQIKASLSGAIPLFMHLSMINPGGGGGIGYPRGSDCEVCPRGGDFDHIRYPQGGEFDMSTILNNEEGLEITCNVIIALLLCAARSEGYYFSHLHSP